MAHDEAASATGTGQPSAPPQGGPSAPPQGETEALGIGRIVRNAVTGARWGLGCAGALWIGDLVALIRQHPAATPVQWLVGAGASLFVAATGGAAAGGLLGPLLVPVVRDLANRVGARLDRLRRGDPQARRLLAAECLAGAVLLTVWTSAAYAVAFDVELDLARPESVALVLALSHVAFAVTFALAWRPAVAAGLAVFDTASAWPGVRGIARRTWGVPGALAGLALVAAAPAIWAHRLEVADLPWRDVLPLPAALAALELGRRLTDPAAPRGARIARAARLPVLGVLLASGVAAAQLRPESTTARKLAFDRMLSGRLGYAAWLEAFDFDRDGQLSMLGGGDCAPFDPRRYTGAVDIPGNGIDEDCDGKDQPLVFIRPRGRMPVPRAEVPPRPSIVLVTIDALAAPRLQAIGGGPPVMPNLDALAATSTLFTHCFSQGPSTRLSFPSIFTSRWDSQLTRVFGPRHPYSLASSERQLQDALDEEGYETTAILPTSYFAPTRWASVTRGFQHVDMSAISAGKYDAAQVTDAALRALSATGQEPLYLWLHYYDAHGPYLPPPGYGRGPRSEEALYVAALTFIDRQLGRLVSAIEARPEPVYLFLTSDHATVFHPDPSTRNGHYGNDLYTATLHVPLIVHGPGVPVGRVDAPVSTMDIVPTISDLLRMRDKSQIEGTSLLPEIFSNRRDPERALFHELFLFERELHGTDPLELVSVHEGRYNLVLDRAHGSYELYDWMADYYEQHDRYEDEASSPHTAHLRSLLSAFVQQFDRHMIAPPETPSARFRGGDER